MRWFAAVLALAATPLAAETPDQVAQRYHLAGEVLVAKGGRQLLHRAYGTVVPGGNVRHRTGGQWRYASITKQVVAVQFMQLVARGEAALDDPIGEKTGRPALRGITARMLLTHHSGLANPDSTAADPGGFPAFYRAPKADLAYCLTKPGTPGAPFAYNNCDYLVLGAMLESSPGFARESKNSVWPGHFAKRAEFGITGYVGGKPEPAFELANFGAAGDLVGTASELWKFDRALTAGALLAPAALTAMWTPEGGGSYQALGQWVFPGMLKGCATAKRIVQRDGEIGGVQTRNFILPDDDLVVIVFTNRSSDDFPLGEVWQGKGFVYDLISAAACP